MAKLDRCITPEIKPQNLQIIWNVQFITVFVPAWMIPPVYHQEREFRQCNRCPVCPPHLVRRPRGAQRTYTSNGPRQPQPLHGLKLAIKEEVLPMKDQLEFSALALLASRGLLAPDALEMQTRAGQLQGNN